MSEKLPHNLEQTPEEVKESLLEKVNKKLKSLNSPMDCEEIKETIAGYEILKGKKIIMIDDDANLLDMFVEDLMVATDGAADFIFHKDQSLEELVSEILKNNSEIVLMDGYLNKLKGHDVVRQLLKQNPSLKCFGFSSSENLTDKFKEAGVTDVIIKNPGDPEQSIKDVAKVVGKLEK